MMRCVEISQPGGPEVLRLAERQVPQPGAGEILIKVAAAGVNRPDVAQRTGSYPPPKGDSDLPGLEASGHVVALGAGVTEWRLGDAVCALMPGGGYAEYAVTPAAQALPVPEGLSLEEAACLPETVFTVWSNLVSRAGLLPGELLLVHGGSSGIGTMAIQLAKLHGARVFVTAGSDEKCAACLALGAERAINYRTEDFVEVLKAEGGADVILDMIGGDYFPRNLKALAPEGRLQLIAFLGGAKVSANLAPLMMQRQTISGSTLRAQKPAAKAAIRDRVLAEVWPWVAAGRVRPVMDSRFALADAAKAHERMESSAHIGKIVLIP